MLPIETTLVRNNTSDRLKVPYYAQVHCESLINFGPDFKIPVRAEYVGMKKTLSVEVAGFRLMTEHLNAIPAMVERLIEGVARNGRLPHYVFIARDAGIVFPVYTLEDEVMAPTPNGPRFQHVELAKVRERLSDYLHEIGKLGRHGRTDKLHVRGISRSSLRLKRPFFYLKKRAPKENDFWAPVFRSHDDTEIYAYAANARRSAPMNEGGEVLSIREQVSEALIIDNRLSDTYDLRIDRLFADSWEMLERKMQPIDEKLAVSGVPIPLYQLTDDVVVGLETRFDEDRYSLFIGRTKEEVAERVQRDFNRRGIGT